MEKLKGKCAVFLDIDGTLTYRHPIPSDKVADAIHKAQAAGHKIILNTGRGRGNVYNDMLEKIKPDGIICAMGQYIELGGEIIRRATLTDEMKKVVLDIAKKKGYGGYMEGISTIYGVPYGDCSKWGFDFESVPRAEDAPEGDVLKLSLMAQADSETIETLEKYFVVYQHPEYFESSLKGYTKAEGMRFVAEMLGIPHENRIAVGDSNNDTDMIEAAGVGVAMGNATAELKAIADIVTESNANDGVAVILEQLLEM